MTNRDVARLILPLVTTFYADPKNQAEFEKWLEKRNTKKKEVEEEE